MPDETVDPAYKQNFSIAYALTQSPETAAVVEHMIKKEQNPEHRRALEAGRKEHEIEAERHHHEHLRDEYASEGRRMSKGKDKPSDKENAEEKEAKLPKGKGHIADVLGELFSTIKEKETNDKVILDQYYEEMGPLPSEEEDAKLIAILLETQQKEPFKGSDRVGEGPALSDAQKKEFENFEHSQRARAITKDAKDAAVPSKQQEAIDRMAAARKRRQEDKEKDGGRD